MPTPTSLQRFLKERYSSLDKKGKSRAAYSEAMQTWRSMSKKEKDSYAVSRSDRLKEYEKLKEYRIPSLMEGNRSPEDIAEHIKDVKKFSKRHGLKVEELYELIRKSTNKRKTKTKIEEESTELNENTG